MYPEESLSSSHMNEQDLATYTAKWLWYCFSSSNVLNNINVNSWSFNGLWLKMCYIYYIPVFFTSCVVTDMCTLIPRKWFNNAALINDEILSLAVTKSVDTRWVSSPTKVSHRMQISNFSNPMKSLKNWERNPSLLTELSIWRSQISLQTPTPQQWR